MHASLWTEKDEIRAQDHVAELLQTGNRIGAILELRERTGSGFREAEPAVATLTAALPHASSSVGPAGWPASGSAQPPTS